MGSDKYNQPAEGAQNWDVPLNENFRDLGIEVLGEVESFSDLPAPDANEESTHGEHRTILVRQSRTIYRDTGTGWEPVAGLGSPESPVSGTVYHEAQVINGTQLYLQENEPDDADEGDVWIDTS